MDGTKPRSLSPTALMLRSLDREHGFETLHVEGKLPDSLDGTLIRIGPGLFDSVGVPVTHLFEADGAVTAVRIGRGKVEASIRVLDTRGLRDERKAGVPLYGPRASYPRRLKSALANKIKNPANTAPLLYQNRLFAMWEAGKPTELDIDTLATIGETSFDGVIPTAFSAHPHRVEARRAYYNFGTRYGRKTVVDLFELPDAGRPRRIGSIPLKWPVMLHDFVATETKLIFFVSPFEVVVPRAVLQLGPFEKMFRWNPRHGTEVIVVPIDAPSEVTRFTVPAFFQWHFGNAFDDGSTALVDFVRFDDPDSFYRVGQNAPLGSDVVRLRVDPKRRQVDPIDRVAGAFEFPTVDMRRSGSRHRHMFSTAESATTRGIARHDRESGTTDVYSEGTHTWFAEPVYAAKPGGAEGEGHLLTLKLDAERELTELLVFDALHVADGPVARASFGRALPMTFHGTFRAGPG